MVIGLQWDIKMPIYYSAITKGFYDTDRVQYHILPDQLYEITIEQRDYLVNEMNSNNKVIAVQNGQLLLQEKTVTWNDVRPYRNHLLSESDKTQLPDFPEAKKTEWATYRRALRDIPQTYTTPEEVIWPTPPT
jgi:hypothetical protein